MFIKLISPKMSLRPMDSEYKRVLSPSLSLITLAAITPHEHQVVIEDENAGNLRFDDSPDLVGITVNVDTSRRAYDIALKYRARRIPVIVGGIHPSADPDEALAFADAVCIGEAEPIWEQILADAATGTLQKKYYCDKPFDMKRIPPLRWDLIDQSKYLYTNIMYASRGCPFKCDFCYNSCDYVHNCHRNRPVTQVIEEINLLPTRQVMFVDDNFIGNIKWVREFIDAIRPMNLTWHAAVSTNIGAHPELMDMMFESGCRSLFIGFESINGNSVKSAHKVQNHVDNYEKLITELHDRGIMINASMVFGFDDDHPDVFRNTLDWLVKNKIETMTAHVLTPYPGTRLYQQLSEQNRIIDTEPTHYNTSHAVFRPKHMTPDELREGYLWIYDRFYSLKNIYKRLPRCREQWIPFLLFNLGYRKFGKLTSLIAKTGLMNAFGRLARRLAYGID